MDGDEDNIAVIVCFLKEVDVPNKIKTLCNTGQVNDGGGANISGIVSFLKDGSVPDTIKTPEKEKNPQNMDEHDNRVQPLESEKNPQNVNEHDKRDQPLESEKEKKWRKHI